MSIFLRILDGSVKGMWPKAMAFLWIGWKWWSEMFAVTVGCSEFLAFNFAFVMFYKLMYATTTYHCALLQQEIPQGWAALWLAVRCIFPNKQVVGKLHTFMSVDFTGLSDSVSGLCCSHHCLGLACLEERKRLVFEHESLIVSPPSTDNYLVVT